ncbi:MAG: hypothetical protein NVS3B20_03070 [Polyangiales bacterium]
MSDAEANAKIDPMLEGLKPDGAVKDVPLDPFVAPVFKLHKDTCYYVAATVDPYEATACNDRGYVLYVYANADTPTGYIPGAKEAPSLFFDRGVSAMAGRRSALFAGCSYQGDAYARLEFEGTENCPSHPEPKGKAHFQLFSRPLTKDEAAQIKNKAKDEADADAQFHDNLGKMCDDCASDYRDCVKKSKSKSSCEPAWRECVIRPAENNLHCEHP